MSSFLTLAHEALHLPRVLLPASAFKIPAHQSFFGTLFSASPYLPSLLSSLSSHPSSWCLNACSTELAQTTPAIQTQNPFSFKAWCLSHFLILLCWNAHWGSGSIYSAQYCIPEHNPAVRSFQWHWIERLNDQVNSQSSLQSFENKETRCVPDLMQLEENDEMVLSYIHLNSNLSLRLERELAHRPRAPVHFGKLYRSVFLNRRGFPKRPLIILTFNSIWLELSVFFTCVNT